MAMKQLLTTEQMAGLLQVTPRHLWELQKRKLIPSLRLGRILRYDAEEVIRAMKTHVN